MDLRQFWILFWLCVSTVVGLKEMLFDCCKVPLKIPIDPKNIYEFSVGNQSVARVEDSNINAKPPFTAHRNESLTLEECVTYQEKIIFQYENGTIGETITQHLGKPCPTNSSLVVILVVVFVVIGAVIGIIVPVLHSRRRTSAGSVRFSQGRAQPQNEVL